MVVVIYLKTIIIASAKGDYNTTSRAVFKKFAAHGEKNKKKLYSKINVVEKWQLKQIWIFILDSAYSLNIYQHNLVRSFLVFTTATAASFRFFFFFFIGLLQANFNILYHCVLLFYNHNCNYYSNQLNVHFKTLAIKKNKSRNIFTTSDFI